MQNILVTGYAAEGKSLARYNDKVIFISGAVPGDVVDIMLTKSKASWAEARVEKINQLSHERVEPFCRHFGTCGGCKWQMLPYDKQLAYKEQEAKENLKRIGNLNEDTEFLPIVGCDKTIGYRNKLEFTASNKRYLTSEEIHLQPAPSPYENALGYHAPRIFDKIINITECYLMDDVNNQVRNTVRTIVAGLDMTYYDIKNHTGWLRNIIIRNTTTGGLMVNICFNTLEEQPMKKLFDQLLQNIPSITTLLYTINPKWNDSIYDLQPQVYYGEGMVYEKLGNYSFSISPKSFFQTNTYQAEKLYEITRDFAAFTGNEVLYDLYCGTGSIGIFCSHLVKKLIGVEVIEDAVNDAAKNAEKNNVQNAQFFAGDVIKICNDEFFKTHGKPDVVITDPPRAGMHEKLVNKLLEIEAPKIVYVSCNTATQARDVALLSDKYRVVKVQPVDMFPHTHHIECVALLVKK